LRFRHREVRLRVERSFSFPFSLTIIDYGAGAEIGWAFTVKFVALFGHVRD
jgi:hypothetical protein